MKKRDTFYFSHDSTAMDDPKIVALVDSLGMEGTGIFWALIEVLRNQPNYKYPIQSAILKYRQWNTSADKIRVVILNYNLFVVEDEEFFSLSLNKRMQKFIDKGQKMRELAYKRWNKGVYALPTHSESNAIEGKEKEKENKIEGEGKKPLSPPIAIDLNLIDKKQREFRSKIRSLIGIKIKESDAWDFFNYWAQPIQGTTKLLFEDQKTWDLNLRIKTWLRKKTNFEFKSESPSTAKRTGSTNQLGKFIK